MDNNGNIITKFKILYIWYTAVGYIQIDFISKQSIPTSKPITIIVILIIIIDHYVTFTPWNAFI